MDVAVVTASVTESYYLAMVSATTLNIYQESLIKFIGTANVEFANKLVLTIIDFTFESFTAGGTALDTLSTELVTMAESISLDVAVRYHNKLNYFATKMLYTGKLLEIKQPIKEVVVDLVSFFYLISGPEKI